MPKVDVVVDGTNLNTLSSVSIELRGDVLPANPNDCSPGVSLSSGVSSGLAQILLNGTATICANLFVTNLPTGWTVGWVPLNLTGTPPTSPVQWWTSTGWTTASPTTNWAVTIEGSAVQIAYTQESGSEVAQQVFQFCIQATNSNPSNVDGVITYLFYKDPQILNDNP